MARNFWIFDEAMGGNSSALRLATGKNENFREFVEVGRGNWVRCEFLGVGR